MRFIVFRHAAHEGLGTIADWLQSQGHTWFYVNLYSGVRPPPAMALNYDGCILMGGPQSVNHTDKYPEVEQTLHAARTFLRLGKPLLGVCLGAQAIAKAAGARVSTSVFEFGFSQVHCLKHPLTAGLPQAPLEVFQWHGENFAVPDGATLLFQGDSVTNQGFVLGVALALQFHLELSPELYSAWKQVIATSGEKPLLNQLPDEQTATSRLFTHRQNLFSLLDNWQRLF